MGDLPAETFQELDQERRGSDAINVVIPIDDEGFALGPRPEEAIDGGPHIGEQERVGQIPKARVEKTVNRFRGGEVPIDEALGEEGGDAGFV